MSKVEMHAPFTTFSGTIGKLVYRKVKGKTIVAMKPDPERPLSEKEVAHRQVFSQASTWAKAALQDEDLGPFYEALGKKRDLKAHAAAVSDFLKPPTLEALDLSDYTGLAGQRIYFRASDNGGIANATVTISDGGIEVMESGQAAEVDPGTGYWSYSASRSIPTGVQVAVTVKVSDRPGNVMELTEEKIL